MSPGIAATQSIVLPVLGEDASDWKDGLAHAASWATKITHARKAYPELDQKLTPFIHQCTAPGALKVLNSLLAGKGKEQVEVARGTRARGASKGEEDIPKFLNLVWNNLHTIDRLVQPYLAYSQEETPYRFNNIF